MRNQKQHWNKLHKQRSVNHYSDLPSDFAEEVLGIIKPFSLVLELGCGVGNDSAAFAKAGHTVLATDFSEVAIIKNSERFKDIPNLSFEALDISMPMEFKDNHFDVVYARLSLHYFSDKATKKVFKGIHRVLRPNSFLCFICKSIKDPLYGKGEELEKDMFEYDGHLRHFFSEEYVKECLGNNFRIEKIESGEEKFYGKESAFVKLIARVVKQ